MRFRWFLPVWGILSFGWPQSSQVAYLKYFLNRNDFLGNHAVSPFDRKGKDHWIVFYNEQDLPVIIRQIRSTGDTLGTDILGYDDEQTLTQKYHFDSRNHLQRIVVFGENEVWSQVFREWAFPDEMMFSFQDQQTRFDLDSLGRIQNMTFITVDGHPYGRISMDYTVQGRKRSEVWIQLPEGRVIRRYKYHFDEDGTPVSLREFGQNGELVSDVDLTFAPADQLYRTPPPKLGNRLLEAQTIIESIRESRVSTPHPAIIPVLTDDLLQLTDGQLLIGSLIQSTTAGLKIQLRSGEVLDIPLNRISWARSRNGKYLVDRGISVIR